MTVRLQCGTYSQPVATCRCDHPGFVLFCFVLFYFSQLVFEETLLLKQVEKQLQTWDSKQYLLATAKPHLHFCMQTKLFISKLLKNYDTYIVKAYLVYQNYIYLWFMLCMFVIFVTYSVGYIITSRIFVMY